MIETKIEMKTFEVHVAFTDEPAQKREIQAASAAQAANDAAKLVWAKPSDVDGGIWVKDLKTGEVSIFDVEIQPHLFAFVTEVSSAELQRRLVEAEMVDSHMTASIDDPTPETMRERSAFPPPITVLLQPAQLDLLVAALDSHRGQLADEKYRDGGDVNDPGTDDPERLGELVASQALIDKLEVLRPKDPPKMMGR